MWLFVTIWDLCYWSSIIAEIFNKRAQQWLAQCEITPPLNSRNIGGGHVCWGSYDGFNFAGWCSHSVPGMHRDHNAPTCNATRSACGHIVGCDHNEKVNLDRNLKPKLAIMRQCTSVTDRWTLTSQHKREMYILHLALKMKQRLHTAEHLLQTSRLQVATHAEVEARYTLAISRHRYRRLPAPVHHLTWWLDQELPGIETLYKPTVIQPTALLCPCLLTLITKH